MRILLILNVLQGSSRQLSSSTNSAPISATMVTSKRDKTGSFPAPASKLKPKNVTAPTDPQPMPVAPVSPVAPGPSTVAKPPPALNKGKKRPKAPLRAPAPPINILRRSRAGSLVTETRGKSNPDLQALFTGLDQYDPVSVRLHFDQLLAVLRVRGRVVEGSFGEGFLCPPSGRGMLA